MRMSNSFMRKISERYNHCGLPGEMRLEERMKHISSCQQLVSISFCFSKKRSDEL